jgi:hypothetical protein
MLIESTADIVEQLHSDQGLETGEQADAVLDNRADRWLYRSS